MEIYWPEDTLLSLMCPARSKELPAPAINDTLHSKDCSNFEFFGGVLHQFMLKCEHSFYMIGSIT